MGATAGERAARRPLILGVLNTTPDSFSDGGSFLDPAAALAQAKRLVADGAEVIDVGGESTRPGATPVPRAEEIARVLPVIEGLTAAGIPVSIDTIHAETAAAAVAAGAAYINDVSGGLHDPEMLALAARAGRERGVRYIAGHWRGIPDPGHVRSDYGDVVAEVRDALAARADAAIAAGLDPALVILDPGLGFDKTGEQCWELLRGLDELRALGYPVLVGASRKRMLAEVLDSVPGAPSGRPGRDLATAVVSALAARAGAWGVRVHDAAGSAVALAVELAWGSPGSAPAARGTRPEAPAAPPAAAPVSAVPQQTAAIPRDRITLTGLEVFAHHGVFDFERERGQRFFIDAELAVDLLPAAAGDDLASTVHYGVLAEEIVAAVAADPVDLIETVAERVAAVALRSPAVAEARITVHKPDAPITAPFADVSVTVVRGRAER